MNIPKGTVITGKMVAIKRPGTGIKPKYYKKLISRRAKQEIRKNQVITWEKVAA
ncbi:hypothetical protein HY948_03490 [Candidatus Gottesmanbacteria bacterium]|nr:hypothetical protein [Candidatus Gottesmanbacteria bacterium]